MRPSLLRPTSNSSKRWLARQFRDPYVQQRVAHPAHFRSRSAFKLLELDASFRFILPRGGRRAAPQQQQQRPRVIVDLGAAPGGWSQVVALKYGFVSQMAREDEEPEDMQFYGLSREAKLVRQGAWSDRVAHSTSRAGAPHVARPADPHANPDLHTPPRPTIIALDLQRISPVPGVHTLQADFLAPTTTALIRALLPRATTPQLDTSPIITNASRTTSIDAVPPAPIDLLLSDMAPNVTGHAAADAEHALRLCDAVARFAEMHLATGGVLVLKYFTHPSTDYFRRMVLAPAFRRVHIAKPPASRTASAEGYWVCVGYRGGLGLGERERKQREREREGEGEGSGVEDVDEGGKQIPPEIPTEPFQLSLSEMRRGGRTREGSVSASPGPNQDPNPDADPRGVLS